MVGDVNPEVLVQFLLESETEPLLDNYLLAQQKGKTNPVQYSWFGFNTSNRDNTEGSLPSVILSSL